MEISKQLEIEKDWARNADIFRKRQIEDDFESKRADEISKQRTCR